MSLSEGNRDGGTSYDPGIDGSLEKTPTIAPSESRAETRAAGATIDIFEMTAFHCSS